MSTENGTVLAVPLSDNEAARALLDMFYDGETGDEEGPFPYKLAICKKRVRWLRENGIMLVEATSGASTGGDE